MLMSVWRVQTTVLRCAPIPMEATPAHVLLGIACLVTNMVAEILMNALKREVAVTRHVQTQLEATHVPVTQASI